MAEDKVEYVKATARDAGAIPEETKVATHTRASDGAEMQDVYVNGGAPDSLPLPAGAATSAKQDLLLTELEKKADLTETQPVSAASLPLPSGAATSANQTNGSQIVQVSSILDTESTLNSTSALLGSGGVWTGTAENVLNYSSIGVLIEASHNSATNGVAFQFSMDNINWYSKSFTYPAATAKFSNLPREAKWFRVSYTNSAAQQTYFRVQTIYGVTATKESTLRLSEDVDGETAASLVRAVIAGQINGVFRNVRLDEATGYLVFTDVFHHETHSSNAFIAGDLIDLGNGLVRDILIVTPNTTHWAHMFITIVTESETDLKMYEGTTASNNGTAITAFNKNRNSATAATTLIFHTPTVAPGSEGVMLPPLHWGSGKGVGGGERSSEEWELKQNTKYLLRITNSTTSANQTNTILRWYEHTNIV